MTFGDSEQQGIRSDHHFYHRDMGFAIDFPVGWQINNNPDSLQAISSEGRAIIEMGAADINRKLSPKQFIKDRLKISKLKSGQKLSSHGLDGYTGLVDIQNKPARVAVVYIGARAFIFFASVKENKTFEQFDQAFLATAKSLHVLRKDEFELAKALRIEVVTVGRQDNYRSWAKDSRISNSPIQQLRLLNGHYPSAELSLGQQAKRVK